MRFFASATAALVTLSLLASAHVHEPSLNKRHLSRSPSVQSNISLRRSSNLEKRFDNAKFSFYDAGLGACGKHNSGGDFIVALNSAQFAGGAHCFNTITINYKGKSTQAQIVDECPGCPFGGLDFSRGLFNFFASEAEGIIYGTWNFGSGAPPPPPPPKPKPETTSTWKPSPTPTPKPSPTTSEEPKTTTSQAKTSSSSSSKVETTSSSTSSSPSAMPSSTAPAIPTGALAQLNLAFVDIANLAVLAATNQN